MSTLDTLFEDALQDADLSFRPSFLPCPDGPTGVYRTAIQAVSVNTTRLPDEPTAAFVIRHELEHAGQWLTGRQYHQSRVIRTYKALLRFVDDRQLLYGDIPHEMDANTAAAYYVLNRYGFVPPHPAARHVRVYLDHTPDRLTVPDRAHALLRRLSRCEPST